VEKEEVIAEIRRLTTDNGGAPVGQRRFFAETGIRPHEILGRLWATWGEALAEAGFPPNAWSGPTDEDRLMVEYVALARRLGKLPTRRDLGVEAASNPGAFPSPTTFLRRFGVKEQIASRVRTWCTANPGNEDVLALCPESLTKEAEAPSKEARSDVAFGYVYLLKSGRFYKIGRANDAGRRQYEIRLLQPEGVEEVWKIKTDDPAGIEAYWHRRFAERRKGGEWFDLRSSEVAAFKRWRRIY
jgi:hypothetical protein